MPRMPIPSDSPEFSEETREAVRHILATRNSMPPPSSYLTYAGKAADYCLTWSTICATTRR